MYSLLRRVCFSRKIINLFIVFASHDANAAGIISVVPARRRPICHVRFISAKSFDGFLGSRGSGDPRRSQLLGSENAGRA